MHGHQLRSHARVQAHERESSPATMFSSIWFAKVSSWASVHHEELRLAGTWVSLVWLLRAIVKSVLDAGNKHAITPVHWKCS